MHWTIRLMAYIRVLTLTITLVRSSRINNNKPSNIREKDNDDSDITNTLAELNAENTTV